MGVLVYEDTSVKHCEHVCGLLDTGSADCTAPHLDHISPHTEPMI